MRPTEEKRQQTIKTYLKLLRELESLNEIKGMTAIVDRYGLHRSVSSTLQEMGIIDKFAHVYTWINTEKVNLKLARKVYEMTTKKLTDSVMRSQCKASFKTVQKAKTPAEYTPPKKFKQRYDFARLHGFGEHSPISKMIKALGNGNYIYGHRLFERNFKDWMKRGRLISEIIQADQRDNLYSL